MIIDIWEMWSAPRNPAPRNHCFVWIVKPSGCHCTVFMRPPLDPRAGRRRAPAEGGGGRDLMIKHVIIIICIIIISSSSIMIIISSSSSNSITTTIIISSSSSMNIIFVYADCMTNNYNNANAK